MSQAHAATGRQRNLLAQAQALISELRALPLDPATTRSSYPRMFELVRCVKRYVEATAALPADDTRSMWEQRGTWLQEEVAGLAQERIYSADQQQQWLNLILLLFAGAEACDRALREKVELELSLASHAKAVAELQQQLAEARAEAEQAAQRTAVPQSVADDLLEARSKAGVLAAELDRARQDAAQQQQQMQLLAAERDSLSQQVEALRGELRTANDTAASRQEVIQALMSKTESSSSQGAAAVAELGKLQVHVRTLSVNLETNAKVIEKLVELNSELMDSLNVAAASAEVKAKHQQQQQGLVPGAAAAAAAAAGGASGGSSSSSGGATGLSGSGPGAVGVPPGLQQGAQQGQQPWAYRNGATQPHHAAPPPAGIPTAAPAHAAPPPPLLPVSHAAAHSGTANGHGSAPAAAAGSMSASASAARPGPGPGQLGSGPGDPGVSLTDAFAAFLKDEPKPAKPATADLLAMLPPGPSGSGKDGGGGGVGGGRGWGLMGALRYVAGVKPGVGADGVGGGHGVGLQGQGLAAAAAALGAPQAPQQEAGR